MKFGCEVKEEQQYGEWLRAEPLRVSRKIVVVVPGASRSQAPWWRKRDSNKGPSKGNAENPKETQSSPHSAANMAMDYVEISKPMHGNGSNVDTVRGFGVQNVEVNQGLHANKPTNKLEEIVVGLNLNDKLDGFVGETNGEGRKMSVGHDAKVRKGDVRPLQDCTNQITISDSVGSTRKWKKLARDVGRCGVSPSPMNVDRRPVMDVFYKSASKKQRLSGSNYSNKENDEVAAESQRH